jgi:glucan 1,3-beta-glucosidase
MYDTTVEHHTLYEYQLVGTSNIFMGQIQTETAYYQPNPPAPVPFPRGSAWSSLVFPDYQQSGWGLGVVNSMSTFTVQDSIRSLVIIT